LSGVQLYDGNSADTVIVNGGVIATGGSEDFFTDSSFLGDVGSTIVTLGGNDVVSLVGGQVGGPSDRIDIDLGDGNDSFFAGGLAILHGAASGGAGDDQFTVDIGGTVEFGLLGGAGSDTVNILGGSVGGNIDAESVTLSGGSIAGDVTGISTLVINDPLTPERLELRDGVVFSGTNAVATIVDTDLAAGGTRTQVFSGFDAVTVDPSTIGFGSGTIGIGQLNLLDGSTLFVNGTVNMTGSANVIGSTIDMLDGAADDVFTLGGLALNNARLLIDVNQQALIADRISAGTLSATGSNVILVNLLGTPSFALQSDVPIIVSTNGIPPGAFTIQGIPGTPGSLFLYQVLPGPSGGLILRITPADFGIAAAPQAAVNSGTVGTALDALEGIVDDALAADLGLAVSSQGVQISPTVGVFASGQFARTEHDGFTISSNGFPGAGPDFSVDEFSAAISIDFNAAKHFQFDQQYGLNLGVFAGYASADVAHGAFRSFDAIGDGFNKSGMFGGYGLFRSGFNYALVATTAFLGDTDVTNDVLNTTGSYDTQGYGLTGSVGHIFVIGDRVRFDLRGGLLGVIFTGDEFTDSGGNHFGDSRISFGAVKFEPGVYADYTLESGRVISPYARLDLQQRFGYTNYASIDGQRVNFDDADFSAAVMTGFNLKMSDMATLSGEVRGKFSADSATLGAKLGVKIAF